jgi:predicted MFS family arabinose efflux permease
MSDPWPRCCGPRCRGGLGVTAWGFFPPQQACLIGIVGLKNAPIILSLNSSFQYLGFSLAAALGSVTLAIGGPDDLAWVGSAPPEFSDATLAR